MQRQTLTLFVDTLLFDLDGTLLDHESASRRALVSALESHFGARADPSDDLMSVWAKLEEHYFQQYLDGKISFAEQRRCRTVDFVAATMNCRLTNSEADDLFNAYRAAYENEWRPFADVHPFLGRLQSGTPIQIAVVTNGELAQQEHKMRAIGLGGMRVFASSAVGYRKPRREIFEYACKMLHTAPHRTAFVGDNIEADAKGAVSAGLIGVWLQRGAEIIAEMIPPRIGSLADLTVLPYSNHSEGIRG